MRKYSLLLCVLFCLFSVGAGWSQPARKTQSLNSHWKFSKGDPQGADLPAFPDQDWQVVSLPHTWNAQDVLPDGQRGYYRGPGWYRNSFFVSEKLPQKEVFLHFEGANQEADVYINGKKAGHHAGGYTAFTVRATPYLVPGQANQVAVRVSNAYNPLVAPLSADFTFLGGIYRDVWLVATGAVHFDLTDHGATGLYVTTPTVSATQATLQIKARISSSLASKAKITLVSRLKDRNGKVVKEWRKAVQPRRDQTVETTLGGDVKGIRLWSPDAPVLYSLESELVAGKSIVDALVTPVGFRWYRFDPQEGFFLNGKHLKLMGANRHQDQMGLGNALSDEHHVADLKLLKDMGANFVRLAHYPQDPAVLAAADALGLIVWMGTPLVNEITLDPRHHEQAASMLREMIRQYHHHPSIVMWGYMNEIYWAHRFLDSTKVEEHTRQTVALARKLEALARQEDPSRYTVMAMHNYPLYEASGIADIPMVAGWNLYHGWYYGVFEDFGAFMDEQHRKYPRRSHLISEYGAGADSRMHSLEPEKFDFSAEYQRKFHQSYLQQIQARPYLAGAAVWNLIDFSSERRIDATPHLNNKGLMEFDRKPKDTYYYYQAALGKAPLVKIAGANWTKRKAMAAPQASTFTYPIEVYGNTAEAELFLNGVSLGTKNFQNYVTQWQVALRSGRNQVEVRSKKEGQVISDLLEIDLELLPATLKAAGTRLELAVNVGSKAYFQDPHTAYNWLPDQPYTKGSWGYIAGNQVDTSKKVSSKEDILTVAYHDPLFQTMREGMEAYQFDVPVGEYEVELLFVETYPKSRRFVDDNESPAHPGGIRVFDVLINGEPVIEGLDLLKIRGYNYPYQEKFLVTAKGEQGLRISFQAQKGKPLVSGIKIKRL